jgi:hypothetical protein
MVMQKNDTTNRDAGEVLFFRCRCRLPVTRRHAG